MTIGAALTFALGACESRERNYIRLENEVMEARREVDYWTRQRGSPALGIGSLAGASLDSATRAVRRLDPLEQRLRAFVAAGR